MAPTHTEGSASLDCMVLTLSVYVVVNTGTGLWRVRPPRTGSELVSPLCREPAQGPHYTEGPSQDPAHCRGGGRGAMAQGTDNSIIAPLASSS